MSGINSLLDQIVNQITYSESRPPSEFKCPVCGGVALWGAGLETTRDGRLVMNLSLSCKECGPIAEMDGLQPVPKWLIEERTSKGNH